MTLFSQVSDGDDTPKENVNDLLDKQQNGFDIEKIVIEHQLTYLEATVRWMEENSIPEGNHGRHIPSIIVEKIKNEAIQENMLRPSVAKRQQTNSLEFLL